MAIKINKLSIFKIKEQGYYVYKEVDREDNPTQNEIVDEGIALDADMLLDKINNWLADKEL